MAEMTTYEMVRKQEWKTADEALSRAEIHALRMALECKETGHHEMGRLAMDLANEIFDIRGNIPRV